MNKTTKQRPNSLCQRRLNRCFRIMIFLCLLLLIPVAGIAKTQSVCLTANVPGHEVNRLQNGFYRIVWSGTTQPRQVGDPRMRDWIPFSEGELTNGKEINLPCGNFYTKELNISYAWGPDDYAIEVDLGRVCEVTEFKLNGTQKWYILKAYYSEAKRWLPVASARESEKMDITGFRTRRFRVDIGGIPSPHAATFSEFYVWGIPLKEEAVETRPPPMAPDDKIAAYEPLALRPSARTSSSMAPDPFVLPQPQEMKLGEKRMTLPLKIPVVVPENASKEVRDIARAFIELATGLAIEVNMEIQTQTDGKAVWLGLYNDKGRCEELAQRLKILPESIKPEGYGVEITDNDVVLVGRDIEGLLWATKTFLFLIRVEEKGVISLPMGTVRDYPRTSYRPFHGYSGWVGEFKHGLLNALFAVKYNMGGGLCDKVSEEIMRSNHVLRNRGGGLFPGSVGGLKSDLLEISPNRKRETLNKNRLSDCCSHTDFWLYRFGEKGPGGFPKEPSDPPGQLVDFGLDEMFHNPWMVCPRCRARGLTEREMLMDTCMKAYRFAAKRGYKVSACATGFKAVSPAFDMFMDLPRDVLYWNYDRYEENRILKDAGFYVIAGNAGPSKNNIRSDTPWDAFIIWHWDSGSRASLMRAHVWAMLMWAEENWSGFDTKVEFRSPEWEARKNRVMDFAMHFIDDVPYDIPGTVNKYFTVDLSGHVNRSLADEKFGDGKGWLDEGPTRDMRHLPTGRQMLKGIDYDIPEGAVIVAGPGAIDRDLPDQVIGIPVGRKAAELFFVHTCKRSVWTNFGRALRLLGFYRIRYDDGTFITVPLEYGEHLLEWNRSFNYREMKDEPVAEPVSNAKVAWRGGTDGGHDVTLYRMIWRNPYPDKTIEAIDVLATAQTELNDNRLCLLAVSGREVNPVDVKMAARKRDKPLLRTYRARPKLPAGVEMLDLTRRTMPPRLAAFFPEECKEWETNDKWIKAKVPGGGGDGFEFGAYSALSPDDQSCSGELTIEFKRPLVLAAIGVKGRLPHFMYPGFSPCDINVSIMKRDRKWYPVGEVKGHIGQEGEERWIFPEPGDVAAVKILSTGGLSAVYLYGQPLKEAKADRPPSVEKALEDFGEKVGKEKAVSDDEIKDLLEGM